MNRLRQRAERVFRELGAPTFPRPGEASRPDRVLVYAVRVVVQVVRQAIRDRLPRQAASLSFQSLLSAVPVAVIAFSVLTRFISLQEVDELTRWLSQHMLPTRAQEVAPALQAAASNVQVRALGLAGGLGLFVVGVLLFMNVSAVVNDIWRVRRKRDLVARVVTGVLLLLLVPSLAGLSIYFLQRFVRLPSSADVFLPLAMTVGALWLAYVALPQARVRARPAAVAALSVGVALEAGKTAFGFYVSRIEITYEGLYGAIGFIPLALLWLYVSWLLFLFGVELAYTLQNLRSLWLRDADLHRAPLGATAGGALALRVLRQLYRLGPRTSSDLALELEVAPQAVELTVHRLAEGALVFVAKDRQLVRSARAAEDVTVGDVLGLYSEARHGGAASAEERLQDLLRRLDQARRGVAGELTMADLL